MLSESTKRIISKNISNTTMQEGKVKFFNTEKGFGFITPNGSSDDIFVHVNGLIDEIKENDMVQFETEQGRKGLNAVNVELIND
jgi:CspA family cold shock protein